MATGTAPLTLRVQRLDRDLDLPIDVGTVTFGPQGELAVVSTEPFFDEYLGNIVNAVNAKKELRIKVPPPAGAIGPMVNTDTSETVNVETSTQNTVATPKCPIRRPATAGPTTMPTCISNCHRAVALT